MNSSSIIVGITQRSVPLAGRIETCDALDQAWFSFLSACSIEGIAIPGLHPDPMGYLDRVGASGVILTGGNNLSESFTTIDGSTPIGLPEANDQSPARDALESALLRAGVDRNWPVMGVCRGMQAMNVFYGGSIRMLLGHVRTHHQLEPVREGFDSRWPSTAFKGSTNSYHGFGLAVEDLAPDLHPLCLVEGTVEACSHGISPHVGIMWHPERNEPFSSGDVDLFAEVFRRGGLG